VDEARDTLEQELASFLAAAAAGEAEGETLAIRATAGLGKTRTLLWLLGSAAVPLLAIGHIQVMMPTHDLAEEAQQAFAAMHPEVSSMVLRGRDAINPETGMPMCLKSDLAKKVSEICGRVSESLCQTWDPTAGVLRRAPCRRSCPWHHQLPDRPTVIFLPHAYLTTGVPVAGDIALRVIDEKFAGTLLVENSLSMVSWLPRVNTLVQRDEQAARLDRARDVVFTALRGGRPVNAELRAAGFTRPEVNSFREQELAAAPTLAIHPRMPTTDQSEAIAQVDLYTLRTARARARVWQAIHASWDRPGTERLTLAERQTPDGPSLGIRVHRRDEIDRNVPTILIDADADPRIVETIRPGARFVRLDVAPNADITQVRDKTFSAASLLQRPGSVALRRDVLTVVEREVARAEGRGVLLVATQAVLSQLHRDVDPAASVQHPEELTRPLLGASPRWFGPRLQGVNTYRDFETVILLGRLEPTVAAIDAQLRSLAADSGVSLSLAADVNRACGWFPDSEGWYLRPDGRYEPAKVQHHPDPRGAALLEQIREANLLQAMARTRAVGSERRKRIVILCSIPLPGLPVDRLMDWQEFVTGIPSTLATKVEMLRRAIRKPDGRLRSSLRLSVGGLVADAPEVFAPDWSAREWRRGLSTERLAEVVGHVERLEPVRLPMVVVPRPGGGRGTPTLRPSPA
jgi:hypothetical protein